jgi:hypothetical protein
MTFTYMYSVMYSSDQKNGDVSVPCHPVWTAFRTLSVPVSWPYMALHHVRNIVPFRTVQVFVPAASVYLTLKPRLHFTIQVRERVRSWWLSLALLAFEIDSPAFVVILVALARLRGCSRLTAFNSVRSSWSWWLLLDFEAVQDWLLFQRSIVVILVALARLWYYHFLLPLG